jgi:iron(III) transport system substrate-binding protein
MRDLSFGSRPAISLLLLVALSGMVASTATVRAQNSELQSVIAAAKAEGGKLNIINQSIADPAFINGVAAGMTKKYGFPITINIAPGPTPSALAPQLVQEYKAGRASSTDIFLGDDVNSMVQIAAGSALEVDWKALDPSVPDEALGPSNQFLRLASRIIGCVWYNTDLVKPNDVPKKLSDTLNPKWKGRIASTSFIAGFREAAGLFGMEKEMVDFLRALQQSGNLAGFLRGAAAERIASGEFAMMVVGPGEYSVIKQQKRGAPVEFTILQEMPFISYWTMAIPKNSAHPNLAKLFALYMMTREGQDYFYNTASFDLHFIKGSKSAETFQTAFKSITPRMVTNEILTSRWNDFERVAPALTKAMRGGG